MSYRFKLIFRLFIIFFLGSCGIYITTSTYFWLVGIWFILFTILAIWELIRFVEREYKDLGNFLMAIRQKDFTGSYSPAGKSNPALYKAFNVITEEFGKLRQEKESNYHFLQVIVAHSTVPKICFKETNGEITLMNKAAENLFKKPFFKTIHGLKAVDKLLAQKVQSLESGQKSLIKVLIDHELIHLSVMAKEIKLEGKMYKLVTFQDIKSELDEQELESWQKLIRVLTHEIKNSAIPISTLTEVINQMLTTEDGTLRDLSTLDEEDLDDLKIGLRTITKRSQGLVNFVNNYGELAKVPKPRFDQVNVNQLMQGVLELLKNDLSKAGIEIIKDITSPLTVNVDADLIEQVLINLIKNAKEAIGESMGGKIIVAAYRKQDQIILSVSDNGPGMDKETLNNIFVPFYTTKKQGSGIGLSLSRQIMKAHKGSINVSSQPGKGTTFYLNF